VQPAQRNDDARLSPCSTIRLIPTILRILVIQNDLCLPPTVKMHCLLNRHLQQVNAYHRERTVEQASSGAAATRQHGTAAHRGGVRLRRGVAEHEDGLDGRRARMASTGGGPGGGRRPRWAAASRSGSAASMGSSLDGHRGRTWRQWRPRRRGRPRRATAPGLDLGGLGDERPRAKLGRLGQNMSMKYMEERGCVFFIPSLLLQGKMPHQLGSSVGVRFSHAQWHFKRKFAFARCC
jgi:hypothetical protein